MFLLSFCMCFLGMAFIYVHFQLQYASPGVIHHLVLSSYNFFQSVSSPEYIVHPLACKLWLVHDDCAINVVFGSCFNYYKLCCLFCNINSLSYIHLSDFLYEYFYIFILAVCSSDRICSVTWLYSGSYLSFPSECRILISIFAKAILVVMFPSLMLA